MNLDLRKHDAAREIDQVERALNARLDRQTEIRKRRSIGFRSDRDTWVRIEQQPMSRFVERGNNGLERSVVLHGVTKPEWYQSVSWIDRAVDRMWRADETELIESRHVIPWGFLRESPALSAKWWRDLNSSLDALSEHATAHVAVHQSRITEVITATFPDVDTTIDEWVTAHGDFYWQNLTAPKFCILDWEDWGAAPRGWDAASLWHDSLLVPPLADRVYSERQTDLDSRSGLLCRLMRCAEILTAPDGYADDFIEPSRTHAEHIIDQLSKPW
jgi:hypothetical protein